MSISVILWNGGLQNNDPPLYKMGKGFTPHFIKHNPPLYKTKNRGKNTSKLYKLI